MLFRSTVSVQLWAKSSLSLIKDEEKFVDFNFRFDLNNKVAGEINTHPSEFCFTFFNRESSWFKASWGWRWDPAGPRVTLHVHAVGKAGYNLSLPAAQASSSVFLFFGLCLRCLHLGVFLGSGDLVVYRASRQNLGSQWFWVFLLLLVISNMGPNWTLWGLFVCFLKYIPGSL